MAPFGAERAFLPCESPPFFFKLTLQEKYVKYYNKSSGSTNTSKFDGREASLASRFSSKDEPVEISGKDHLFGSILISALVTYLPLNCFTNPLKISGEYSLKISLSNFLVFDVCSLSPKWLIFIKRLNGG